MYDRGNSSIMLGSCKLVFDISILGIRICSVPCSYFFPKYGNEWTLNAASPSP